MTDPLAALTMTGLANRSGTGSLGEAGHLTSTEAYMFLTIALVLFVIWALCLLVFKITAGGIHLIVVIAVIALIVHFVRGRGTRTPAP